MNSVKISQEVKLAEMLKEVEGQVTSYEGLKQAKKFFADLMKNHPDKPKKKDNKHLKARKEDTKTILTRLMGRTEARKKARTLVFEGAIDPQKWSSKPKEFNLKQAKWALSNMTRLSLFLKEPDAKLITPQDVIKGCVKAGEMKAGAFAKTQLAVG